ncbi:MAG: DUF4367 domain-containing protein [Huintestinicola sp.]
MNIETKEKIFDLVLADALMNSLDMEIQKLDDNHEYDDHIFPAEFDMKNKKIANSIGRKDRIRKNTKICVKAVVTAAAIMGVIFGGLLTQPPVYAAVQNVIRTIFDTFDRYEYIGEELTVDNFNNNIRLGYVPDGYYLSNGDYSHISVSLTYVNEYENEIMLNYGIANGTSSIYDNEHNLYSSFIINGIEYHYYESIDNDFYDTLVWYKDGYVFSILAHLSKEELVKIAENVK